jgi:carbonic anhydrase/acetyltransferase-like protein (isoleucine patch superfamily)
VPVLIEIGGKRPRVADGAFLAHDVTLIGDVEIAAGASIWFGAVLRGDYGPIRIGEESNVQDNVVIHSEGDYGTIVAPCVTVGHAAILHACHIETGCVIGMGAILLSGSRVGAHAMIAAGSVVLENFSVPGGMLAAGNPATVKKQLDGRAAEWLRRGAQSYSALRHQYESTSRVVMPE